MARQNPSIGLLAICSAFCRAQVTKASRACASVGVGSAQAICLIFFARDELQIEQAAARDEAVAEVLAVANLADRALVVAVGDEVGGGIELRPFGPRLPCDDDHAGSQQPRSNAFASRLSPLQRQATYCGRTEYGERIGEVASCYRLFWIWS